MKIGPFYFDTKEIFLLAAAILIGCAWYFDWNLFWFDKKVLLTLVILFLIVKGLLPAVHNEAFLLLSLSALFLTLYFPLFQVVTYFFISFGVFKILKVI